MVRLFDVVTPLMLPLTDPIKVQLMLSVMAALIG
jgi:hypothetical protein